jgi:cell division septation protein DedD
MSDEGFHEIQLNGKQLVFLFMAATVVSVVIFLCGVMVGRGVRAERAEAAATQAGVGATSPEADALQADATTSDPVEQPPGQPAAPPEQAPPPIDEGPQDTHEMLTGEKAKPETLQQPPQRAESVPAPSTSATMVPPEPRPTPAPKVRPDAGPTERDGYAVQLVAVRERSEAAAIVKRLVAKGYQAYILEPQPGSPPVYRVQVGRFKNRRDADRTAARLRREEQFKPWVTR